MDPEFPDIFEMASNPALASVKLAGMSGRPWDEAKIAVDSVYGEGVADNYVSHYKLEAGRKFAKEHMPHRSFGERLAKFGSGPGGAIGELIHYDIPYQEAVEKFQKGEATDHDIGIIAAVERRRELEAEKSTGEAIVDTVMSLPMEVLTFLTGARIASKGAEKAATKFGLGAAHRAMSQPGWKGAVYTGAAATPFVPSSYLPHAQRQAEIHGGSFYSPENLAPAMVIGAVQNSVVGSMSHSFGINNSAIKTIAAKTGIGLGEMQAADIGLSYIDDKVDSITGYTLGLNTRYGAIGDLMRGNYDDSIKAMVVQSITLAAFASASEVSSRGISGLYSLPSQATPPQGPAPQAPAASQQAGTPAAPPTPPAGPQGPAVNVSGQFIPGSQAGTPAASQPPAPPPTIPRPPRPAKKQATQQQPANISSQPPPSQAPSAPPAAPAPAPASPAAAPPPPRPPRPAGKIGPRIAVAQVGPASTSPPAPPAPPQTPPALPSAPAAALPPAPPAPPAAPAAPPPAPTAPAAPAALPAASQSPPAPPATAAPPVGPDQIVGIVAAMNKSQGGMSLSQVAAAAAAQPAAKQGGSPPPFYDEHGFNITASKNIVDAMRDSFESLINSGFSKEDAARVVVASGRKMIELITDTNPIIKIAELTDPSGKPLTSEEISSIINDSKYDAFIKQLRPEATAYIKEIYKAVTNDQKTITGARLTDILKAAMEAANKQNETLMNYISELGELKGNISPKKKEYLYNIFKEYAGDPDSGSPGSLAIIANLTEAAYHDRRSMKALLDGAIKPLKKESANNIQDRIRDTQAKIDYLNNLAEILSKAEQEASPKDAIAIRRKIRYIKSLVGDGQNQAAVDPEDPGAAERSVPTLSQHLTNLKTLESLTLPNGQLRLLMQKLASEIGAAAQASPAKPPKKKGKKRGEEPPPGDQPPPPGDQAPPPGDQPPPPGDSGPPRPPRPPRPPAPNAADPGIPRPPRPPRPAAPPPADVEPATAVQPAPKKKGKKTSSELEENLGGVKISTAGDLVNLIKSNHYLLTNRQYEVLMDRIEGTSLTGTGLKSGAAKDIEIQSLKKLGVDKTVHEVLKSDPSSIESMMSMIDNDIAFEIASQKGGDGRAAATSRAAYLKKKKELLAGISDLPLNMRQASIMKELIDQMDNEFAGVRDISSIDKYEEIFKKIKKDHDGFFEEFIVKTEDRSEAGFGSKLPDDPQLAEKIKEFVSSNGIKDAKYSQDGKILSDGVIYELKGDDVYAEEKSGSFVSKSIHPSWIVRTPDGELVSDIVREIRQNYPEIAKERDAAVKSLSMRRANLSEEIALLGRLKEKLAKNPSDSQSLLSNISSVEKNIERMKLDIARLKEKIDIEPPVQELAVSTRLALRLSEAYPDKYSYFVDFDPVAGFKYLRLIDVDHPSKNNFYAFASELARNAASKYPNLSKIVVFAKDSSGKILSSQIKKENWDSFVKETPPSADSFILGRVESLYEEVINERMSRHGYTPGKTHPESGVNYEQALQTLKDKVFKRIQEAASDDGDFAKTVSERIDAAKIRGYIESILDPLDGAGPRKDILKKLDDALTIESFLEKADDRVPAEIPEGESTIRISDIQIHDSINEIYGSQSPLKFKPHKITKILVTYDPSSGKTFLVDGKRRLDAVQRAGLKNIDVEYIDLKPEAIPVYRMSDVIKAGMSIKEMIDMAIRHNKPEYRMDMVIPQILSGRKRDIEVAKAIFSVDKSVLQKISDANLTDSEISFAITKSPEYIEKYVNWITEAKSKSNNWNEQSYKAVDDFIFIEGVKGEPYQEVPSAAIDFLGSIRNTLEKIIDDPETPKDAAAEAFKKLRAIEGKSFDGARLETLLENPYYIRMLEGISKKLSESTKVGSERNAEFQDAIATAISHTNEIRYYEGGESGQSPALQKVRNFRKEVYQDDNKEIVLYALPLPWNPKVVNWVKRRSVSAARAIARFGSTLKRKYPILAGPAQKRTVSINVDYHSNMPELASYADLKEMVNSPRGMSIFPVIGQLFGNDYNPDKIQRAINTAVATHMMAESIAKVSIAKGATRFGKRPFQTDSDGLVTLVNGTRAAYQDIIEKEMASPGTYRLTPEQKEAVAWWSEVLQEAWDMAKSEGFDLARDANGDPIGPGPYFFRFVLDPNKNFKATPSNSYGGMKPHQKVRKHATAEDAISSGLVLAEFEESASAFIVDVYRRIADYRLLNDPDLGAKMVKKRNFPHTEPIYSVPLFRPKLVPVFSKKKGKIINLYRAPEFAPDVRKRIEGFFSDPGVYMRKLSEATQNIKGIRFGLPDPSALFNQLSLVMFYDNATWRKAAAAWYKSLFDSDYINKILSDPENLKAAQEMTQHGASVSLPEYMEGALTGIAAKLPFGGDKLYQVGANSFSAALTTAKIYMWRNLSKVVPDDYHADLAYAIEAMTSSSRTTMKGMSEKRRMAEGILINAPSMLRAGLDVATIAALDSGPVAQKVRMALASGVMGMVAVTAAAWAALGLSEEEVERRLDIQSGKFLMVPMDTGDGMVEVGAQNIYISLFRLVGELYENDAFRPDTFNSAITGSGKMYPLFQWLRGRAGPLVAFATDMTGRNFMGQPISPLEAAVKNVVPLHTEPLMTSESTGSQKFAEISASMLGGRSYPASEHAEQMINYNRLANSMYGMNYEKLGILQQFNVVMEYRNKYEKSDRIPTDMEKLQAMIRVQESQYRIIKALPDEVKRKLSAIKYYPPGEDGRIEIEGFPVVLSEKNQKRFEEIIIEEYARIASTIPSEQELMAQMNSFQLHDFMSRVFSVAKDIAKKRLIKEDSEKDLQTQ